MAWVVAAAVRVGGKVAVRVRRRRESLCSVFLLVSLRVSLIRLDWIHKVY